MSFLRTAADVKKLTSLAVLVLTYGCRTTAPQPTTPAAQASLVLALAHATLIDGTGQPAQPNVTVLIADGRVAAIQPGAAPVPRGARVIDLTGQYLIPGLIDAHVHLTYPFTTRPRQDSIMTLLFQGGVTSVRDMAGDAVALTELRREGAQSSVPWPRVYYSAIFAGRRFTSEDNRVAPSSHGMTVGEAPWVRAIGDSTDLVQAIEVARWAGATGIKMYAELSSQLVARITAEAHRQGLKVWSHTSIIPARPSDAVRAGVDVISHGDAVVLEGNDTMPPTVAGWARARRYPQVPVESPAIQRLIAAMRAGETMLEPTFYVVMAQNRRFSTDTTRRFMWGMAEWTAAFVRAAHRAGVPIVAGTDLMGWPARDTLPYIHDEVGYLVSEGGLTPVEAIQAATLNGARALGVERDYGSVEVGKVADLVVLRADPLADIANTKTVRLIVKGGVVHERRWPPP